MDFQQFHKNILNDVRIELMDEFDRNFQRKAFFDKKWPSNRLVNRKGSMMARTNNLRRGGRAKIEGEKIVFSNSLPYASIQNEGGEIKVTMQMKKYFWAMYYRASGQIKHNKSGKMTRSIKNNHLSIEAQQFKALALMPVGKKIKIPSRRTIGDHPKIKLIIEKAVNRNLTELNIAIRNSLRQ
ncbi:hypothetical protein EGI16_21415 [Chryseobacterium sp. G0240]|uniref:hypothetical protein n=1 Tax=Chryseobacterium sp. G0240 TaxID=2487066 RepID=UPI000F451140|nr:hypothetical protein [Chryseobacterium sp. G0240]ROH98397.1 hypothetical protein EGI16_21415 [Chryseobacterium sp. G0240]